MNTDERAALVKRIDAMLEKHNEMIRLLSACKAALTAQNEQAVANGGKRYANLLRYYVGRIPKDQKEWTQFQLEAATFLEAIPAAESRAEGGD